jgi:hypothetical protein
LKAALETIKLTTNIPALDQLLISQASLEFPTNIAQTGIASTTFQLNNPFTASIILQKAIVNAVCILLSSSQAS